jgi:hypothetical protein
MGQPAYEVRFSVAPTGHLGAQPLGNSMLVTNFRGEESRHLQLMEYLAPFPGITFEMALVRPERLRQLQQQRLVRAHTHIGATFDAHVLERPH